MMILHLVKRYGILPVLIFCAINMPCDAQKIVFKNKFAPTDAFVKSVEKPYREGICLNGLWQFMPVEHAEKLSIDQIKNPAIPDEPTWDKTPLKVPSPWNVNNFATGDGSGGDFVTYPSYPKSWEHIRAGWLMRKIPYHKEWKNKRLILHFDAIAGYAKIYINKHAAGENFDLFLPFDIDITNLVKPGQDNQLLVWVADAQLFNQPGKYGRRINVAGSFWGQHAIGIWQDVTLVIKPAVNIKNTYINPIVDSNELLIQATVSNNSNNYKKVEIEGSVKPWINLAGKDVISAPEPKWKLGQQVIAIHGKTIKIKPNSDTVVNLRVKVDGRLKMWSADDPNLYGLVLTLNKNKKPEDVKYTRFGWRQFTIKGNQFYLNGKKLVLKGDSWHFMGIPQMTRRYAWAWFTLLKQNHANAVRLHAEPYPPFYMDMADEMGIFVLDESGMWASDGGPKINSDEYWKNSEDHIKRLVLRDRNHPSVFGWSVCNENLPVTMGVLHAPDSLVRKQIAEINKWIAIARQFDPSRVWVSGDGETQAPINSPVIIGHYGGTDENFRALSSKGKVWGIGEAGMAYYATPRQSAVYNGNTSYVSQQGRMEGVADEATKLINMMKKYKASYMSIFNMVWYGIKPLELGLKDTTRAPTPGDGIFFGPYQEGQPGVQPERLGPYTTTLNPGYDPSLPLYKSWPLLQAISDGFSSDSVSYPEKIKPVDTAAVTANKPLQKNDVLLLSTDADSVLYKILSQMGVHISKAPNKNGHNLLIIDGLHTPANAVSEDLQKSVLNSGGTVFIWGVDNNSPGAINHYLPVPVEVNPRQATSFITIKPDEAMNKLGNSDFYFTELSDKPLMTFGLTGEFVRKGTVLLDACNTDWKKWNKRPEYLKTAAVLRSEREYKPEGKALVRMDAGNGKIYVFALNPELLYQTSLNVLRRLFYNLGVSFQNNISKDIIVIGPDGTVNNALILAPFDITGKSNQEIAKSDFLKNTKPADYSPGEETNNHFWEKISASGGVFDIGKNISGPVTNTIAYISFWVYSPRSLSNLLLEPDMPQLDMYINAGNGYQLFLNDKLIKETFGNSRFNNQDGLVKALPLEKGWNNFLIKSIQKKGEWKLAVKFESDKKDFMNELRSQVTP